MTPQQVEKLARKNREAAEVPLDEAYRKRGIKRVKERRTIFVDRSRDYRIRSCPRKILFNSFKGKRKK